MRLDTAGRTITGKDFRPMGWDEWEQLKAGAAGQRGTRMQTDSHPGGVGGPATGGLKTSKAAWTKAGEGLGSLRTSVHTSQRRLEDGQTGLSDTAGCETAGAQKEVHTSWKKYLEKVRNRCDGLQKILEQAGHDLAKTDSAVKAELDEVRTRYQDTPAVGGGR